jgi:hypothetical protein
VAIFLYYERDECGEKCSLLVRPFLDKQKDFHPFSIITNIFIVMLKSSHSGQNSAMKKGPKSETFEDRSKKQKMKPVKKDKYRPGSRLMDEDDED